MERSKVLVIDFGSQYSKLIAKKIREFKIESIVCHEDISLAEIKKINPSAIIFSGGPKSVYSKDKITLDKNFLSLGVPILAICYGMQLISDIFEGEVLLADKQEFGATKINISKGSNLFEGIENTASVWMSHSDHVSKVPKGFKVVARSANSVAAIENKKKAIYCVQFHPEVKHTPIGDKLFSNFLIKIAKIKQTWEMSSIIDEKILEIKNTVKDKKVLLALSGGVDSSVAAALLYKAIGKNLHCFFVNNNLLRLNESMEVINYFKAMGLNIDIVDAKDKFMNDLKNKKDPEAKRKAIGKSFIDVFKKEAKKIYSKEKIEFLAQGTIYSDVIESSKGSKNSNLIKSHHNVGGLPKNLNFSLIEPLRDLFKDEVRELGLSLGIKKEFLWRHPFPGPGFAVRILGEVKNEYLNILKAADEIFVKALIKENLYFQASQSFVVFLPIKSVGVMGDYRTYEYVLSLRSVVTDDFMTARISHLPMEFLEKISTKIINEVKGVNRVVYDITSKPPGTIEWE